MSPHTAVASATQQKDSRTPSFDLIAKHYRWLEYLTFGGALWRCRTHFLPQIAGCRNALILGDGDGRFTAALLHANPTLQIDAVDCSLAMLGLLRQRARAASPDAPARLRTHHTDAGAFVHELASGRIYDLVVTHFFLDCFAQHEVELLARDLTAHLQPGALWLVSDFRIPPGVVRWPARALVRSLYLAFRILTGLRTARLPDHDAALGRAGFARIAQRLSLGGILTTELWVMRASGAEAAYTPHHAVAATTSPG
ncbi:MAG TPA: class I SAM-dependent methyltransferase [Acidobacteriaceae bacterium]|nr:class I SAM-dependent methyltransferase [Acidobacteriaceae bacterium]